MILTEEWYWISFPLSSSLPGREEDRGKEKKEKKKKDPNKEPKGFGYLTNGKYSYLAMKFPSPIPTLVEQIKPLFGLVTMGSYYLKGGRGKLHSVILVPPLACKTEKGYPFSDCTNVQSEKGRDGPTSFPVATGNDVGEILDQDYLKLMVYRSVLRLYFRPSSPLYLVRDSNGTTRLFTYHTKFINPTDAKFLSLPLPVVPDIPRAYALLNLKNEKDNFILTQKIEKVIKEVYPEALIELFDIYKSLNRRLPS